MASMLLLQQCVTKVMTLQSLQLQCHRAFDLSVTEVEHKGSLWDLERRWMSDYHRLPHWRHTTKACTAISSLTDFVQFKLLEIKKKEIAFFLIPSNYLSLLKHPVYPRYFQHPEQSQPFWTWCLIFFPQPTQTQACLTYLNQTPVPLKGPSVNLSSTWSFKSHQGPGLHL